MGGSWDTPNMHFEPGKFKWLTKENQEEIPHTSDLNFHRARLSESTCVSIHMYWTLFFLLLIIHTLHVSLLAIFWGFFLCKAKEPRALSWTTCVVARIWCSHCCDPALISGWEPKPCFKLRSPENKITSGEPSLGGSQEDGRKKQGAEAGRKL